MNVIPDLTICSRGIGLFAGRGFELNEHQRETVHEYHDVGPLLGILHECPLVDGLEGIPVRMHEIDEVNDVMDRLSFDGVGNLDTILEELHELFILLNE